MKPETPEERRPQGRIARLAAALAAGLAVTGCAVTSLDGQRLRVGSEAFSDYVESVFRRQNDVADDLALTLDAAESGSAGMDALETAELELLESCRGLNELARSRRDGDPIGGLRALRRARGAPDCERAADQASGLLAGD